VSKNPASERRNLSPICIQSQHRGRAPLTAEDAPSLRIVIKPFTMCHLPRQSTERRNAPKGYQHSI
jgi:hypothetical protein